MARDRIASAQEGLDVLRNVEYIPDLLLAHKGTNYPMPVIPVDWLLARVKEDVEFPGCLIWQLSSTDGGHNPQARIKIAEGVYAPLKIRRLIWAQTHHRKLRADSHTMVLPTCHAACVNPEHLRQRPRGYCQVGKPRSLEARKAIADGRRKGDVFPQALIEQARNHPGSDQEAADALGMTREYVRQLRRGTRRMEYVAANDPFLHLKEFARAKPR